ncbi:unnamed protein product [Nesidiocoris tenuis]|uniref:RNA-directed DNA polymerase n=1 Tax=Nesidiocoris tenuis TaxID=355587 RepID=A0A6H5G5B2_9HEMI|nr:unnamed protein product [Nesidiocoris tenuis]
MAVKTNDPVQNENHSSNVKNSNLIDFEIKSVLSRYSDLFSSTTGRIVGHKINVQLHPGAQPKVFKARPVPFAMKKAVEQELDRLVTQGIIEPVDPSNTEIVWASPIVIAPKANGKIRLCADFKVSINKYIMEDRHPMPTLDEVRAQISGGEQFSVVDLKDAYLQMEVAEDSKKYLVISTHKGFYQYKRMPFGISSAPAKFQKTMDLILRGIDGVICYLDDIIITGKNREEHVLRVEKVLRRLLGSGLRVNLEKCKWLQNSVVYLGHRFDREGVHPTDDHIKAIQDMKEPTNVKELRSFLGCINYYQKFIKNLQGNCAHLYELLQKGVKWNWTEKHSETIQMLKQILSSKNTLVHYNPALKLVVYADASERGIGGVLCQRNSDGEERPIAFTSRKLSKTEQHYSVIDREALAIVHTVRKFDQYLYGRKFILRTDHKPLIYIFGDRIELPKLAFSRVSRWAVMLNEFDFTIEFIPGKENSPADVLSRLPIDVEEDLCDFGNKIAQTRLQDLAISRRLLKTRIQADLTLSKVCQYISEGWPEKHQLPEHLLTYFEKKDELSYEEGIVLWHGRIVIPNSLHNDILSILHDGHPGSSAMRSIARIIVWWPGIDKAIETFLKTCSACQENRASDPESPIYSWNVPSEPWSRIHIDFAEAFEGHSWLIIVDSSTKWIEISPMKTTTTEKTIEILQDVFARFGLPKIIVSDNGPQLTSQKFEDFCKHQNIKHAKSTPYHPRTNGLAERAVRTFKTRMAASKNSGENLQTRLAKYLTSYRAAVHRTTGRSPSEMMMGRQMRTKLTLLKPDINDRVDYNLMKQRQHHGFTPLREFNVGESVWIKRKKEDKTFSKAVVKEKNGPLSYLVIQDGVERRVHADQMRKDHAPTA